MLNKILNIIAHPTELPRKLRSRKNKKIKKALIQEYVKAYPDIYQGILKMLQLFHAKGGFEFGDNQVLKLLSLYHTLILTKPSSIIEYGTGSSSFVIASYAQKHGIVYQGIEESKKWVVANRELLPKDVANNPDIRLDQYDRIVNQVRDDIYAIETTYKPERYFDFVFLDGPSLVINGTNMVQSYNIDIRKHISEGKPRVICVDNRRSTVEYIDKNFGAFYDLQPSDNWFMDDKIIDPDQYCYASVFNRKTDIV